MYIVCVFCVCLFLYRACDVRPADLPNICSKHINTRQRHNAYTIRAHLQSISKQQIIHNEMHMQLLS